MTRAILSLPGLWGVYPNLLLPLPVAWIQVASGTVVCLNVWEGGVTRRGADGDDHRLGAGLGLGAWTS